MRSNWVRIIGHWLQLELTKGRLTGTAWFQRTRMLLILLLGTETVGLLVPFFAPLALILNIIFGVLLTYRAWGATITLDAADKVKRLWSSDQDAKKTDDVQTMKVVGTLLSVIGVFLGLLLVVVYRNFPAGTYHAWLAVTIVSLFLMGMGASDAEKMFVKIGKLMFAGSLLFLFFFTTSPSGFTGGETTQFHGLHFWEFLNTDWSDAQAAVVYQTRADARDVQGVLAADMKNQSHAEAIANNSAPGQEFARVHDPLADKSYGTQLASLEVQARIHGLRLADNPNQTISAKVPNFQMIYCLNIGTGKRQPCEFFEGDVLEGSQFVTSSLVHIAGTREILHIGPAGIWDTTKGTLPYVPGLPRFALIGTAVDPRTQAPIGKPFVIGEEYTVQRHEYIAAMVNGDYYDCRGDCTKNTKWPSDEWFWEDNHYNGSFAIRIKKIKGGN